MRKIVSNPLTCFFRPFGFALSLVLLALAFGACSSTDSDKIAEAQSCLDKATASTADACAAKVAGLSSPGAYNVRCAAKFISERFEDPTKYIEALNTISSGTGSANMADLMGLLMFSSMGNITSDAANMATTFDYCYQANTKGALLLSSFGYLGASLYNLGYTKSASGCAAAPISSTGYSLDTCLGTGNATYWLTNTNFALALAEMMNPSTADSDAISAQESIGGIVITTYQVSCSSNQANKELCQYFQSAITSAGGASNKRAVAASFLSVFLQGFGVP